MLMNFETTYALNESKKLVTNLDKLIKSSSFHVKLIHLIKWFKLDRHCF